jgi:hypothetical protein
VKRVIVHTKRFFVLSSGVLSSGVLYLHRHRVTMFVVDPWIRVWVSDAATYLFLTEVTAMMRCVVPSLALLAMSVGTMVAGAELKSGLEVGQKAGPYQVKDCTG